MDEYVFEKYSGKWLFRDHQKEQIKKWVKQLEYFYFFRAWEKLKNTNAVYRNAVIQNYMSNLV